MSDSFEDALIQPDDPIPPREDESLVGNFQGHMEKTYVPEDYVNPLSNWHECKCGVEYTIDHYPNCPDCGLESIPENAAVPMKLTYTPEELQQHEDDQDLMEKFSLAMSTMNRYNAMRERMGMVPLTAEEFGVEDE